MVKYLYVRLKFLAAKEGKSDFVLLNVK